MKKFLLFFNKDTNRLRIGFTIQEPPGYKELFDGALKNKSELKKVLQFLNINYE